MKNRVTIHGILENRVENLIVTRTTKHNEFGGLLLIGVSCFCILSHIMVAKWLCPDAGRRAHLPILPGGTYRPFSSAALETAKQTVNARQACNLEGEQRRLK
jgi:hypothetical protein